MSVAEDNRPGQGGIVFPVYRKMADGQHFYRIDGHKRFTEIQRVGRRHLVHRVEATAYPEQLRVAEMLNGAAGRFLPMEAAEWEALFAGI